MFSVINQLYSIPSYITQYFAVVVLKADGLLLNSISITKFIIGSFYMSTPRKPNVKSKPLQYRRYLRGMFLAMVTTLTGVGCDSNDQTNPESPVTILENEIVVDNSMVYTSAPERYQPSYNLQGALQLITNTEVKSPYPALEASIKVKKGDKVQQGQALAEIKTKVAEDKIPFIVNEFLDVYVNGEPITKESAAALKKANGQAKNLEALNEADLPKHYKPTSNDAKPSTNQSSKQASKQTTKLIAVTLVLKSPVEGVITNIANTSDSLIGSGSDSDSKTKQNEVNDNQVNNDNNKLSRMFNLFSLSVEVNKSILLSFINTVSFVLFAFLKYFLYFSIISDSLLCELIMLLTSTILSVPKKSPFDLFFLSRSSFLSLSSDRSFPFRRFSFCSSIIFEEFK